MRAAWAFALLMSTVSLVGCIGGDNATELEEGERMDLPDLSGLSQKVYDILPVEVIWTTSSVDGKMMHNAVFRPDTDDPVPVFINFSPYWGDSAEQRGDNFAQYMIDEYVPRGYAVVLSAVRGTGHSQGCFQIGGDVELQDAYDVVDHFASVAWSNGNVAAGGKSYDSTTQNGMLAKVPHEALKTTFHVSGITDMYRYNYRMGVPYGHGTIFNTYYFFQTTDEYGLGLFGAEPDPTSEDPESLARIVDDAACTEFPQMQLSGVGSGAHGLKDDYWIEREWTRYIADSETQGSIFFVHGLQDWNVKPDHILPWLEDLPEDVPVKGWLHQWTRTPEGGHVYPMRDDWNTTMLRWLDHFLKGVDTGVVDEPAFDVQGSDGLWRASDTWPPDDGTAETVALDGELMSAEPPGPTVYHAVVAVAFDEPMRYAGVPTLTVTATADHADPVLTAVLYDVGPDGEMTWVNEGVLRGIYRNGLYEPEPVQPGTAYEYVLEFYPQDDVLEKGHQWLVAVGEQPRHAQPWPGQMDGVMYEPAGMTMELPMAPVEGPLLQSQPVEIDCFAC